MTGRVYLDASAAVKLVVSEAESNPLRQFLGDQRTRVSNRVLAVELVRAVHRRSPALLDQARLLLQVLEFVELDGSVMEQAAGLKPVELRSLDAIHLASAFALAGELDAFVTYDARQADAARALGLAVAAPT
ncbi:MAG: type II toxin-antitoxin system VapC family toxin [Chloroflexota bacterium]|nr:type II toxin-antitoxin system VapC family toxin [Chloroflexota bacterium]